MTMETVTADHPGRTPENSRVLLAHIMTGNDTNLYGTVHGGVVMKLVDDAAGAAAARHAGGPAVTISVDKMTFHDPVLVGDLLNVDAVVANVGRTSMDLYVQVTAERWDEPGNRRPLVDAFLTFVAVDSSNRPRPVPSLVLETDEQRELQERAKARRRTV